MPGPTNHSIPGARPNQHRRAVLGVGTEPSDITLVQLERTQVGPIHYDGQIARLHWMRSSAYAGQIGNALLSRCAAVIIGVEARTIWFEPPCDGSASRPLASPTNP